MNRDTLCEKIHKLHDESEVLFSEWINDEVITRDTIISCAERIKYRAQELILFMIDNENWTNTTRVSIGCSDALNKEEANV